MEGRCAKHQFEASEDVCRECGNEFCSECLVYSFGPKKPPFCIACALAAAGVRTTAANAPVKPKKELKKEVAEGSVDTVLLAIADMEGRLQGKRLTASHFLSDVLEHGAEGCNYLLAVDVDMETVDGYEMSSWSRGYGDFQMKPDLSTLRPVPWQPGTVMVVADLQWHDGSPVVASPRQILRRQLDRLPLTRAALQRLCAR